MKEQPEPIVSGRNFLPKAPLLWTKWMPAWGAMLTKCRAGAVGAAKARRGPPICAAPASNIMFLRKSRREDGIIIVSQKPFMSEDSVPERGTVQPVDSCRAPARAMATGQPEFPPQSCGRDARVLF